MPRVQRVDAYRYDDQAGTIEVCSFCRPALPYLCPFPLVAPREKALRKPARPVRAAVRAAADRPLAQKVVPCSALGRIASSTLVQGLGRHDRSHQGEQKDVSWRMLQILPGPDECVTGAGRSARIPGIM